MTQNVLARDEVTVAAVDLRGLTKRYGQVTAVDGLDLTIRPGEVVALLGPNGAGKSTTIDMMLGLTTPDRGRAELFGASPAQAVRDGRVGVMLQSGGMLPDLTGAEMVTLQAALYRRSRPVSEALARAGATGFADRLIGGLSGGQQQRIRFATALVTTPDLMVLDEPTTGLDVEARRAFWAAVHEEAGRGRTVVFATHYLDEADAYANRIVLMRAGRIVADGTAAQVKSIVSGRTIKATLPGADPVALAALPGVDEVDVRGDIVLLRCPDSDAALRALLTTTDARDVEVTSRGLEDAFVALTMDGDTSS
ncbi:MAG TPA: ABC transporter ATP-binding protein [Micromonosporaceae bacterium]